MDSPWEEGKWKVLAVAQVEFPPILDELVIYLGGRAKLAR